MQGMNKEIVLGLHLVLVTLRGRFYKIVLSKTNRMGDTKYNI